MTDGERLKTALSPSKDCLTIEQLDAIATGAPTPPHLGTCARCQSELALMRTFDSSEPLPSEGASVAWISAELERRLPVVKGGRKSLEATVWSRWWVRWALSGAAVALVTIVVAIATHPSEPAIVADAGLHQSLNRSEEIAGLEPAGDLPSKPTKLEWQGVAQAAKYEVRLQEIDETTLWSAESSTPSAVIPTGILAKILPGKPILWRVTAVDPSGRVIAKSQLELFRLEPH